MIDAEGGLAVRVDVLQLLIVLWGGCLAVEEDAELQASGEGTYVVVSGGLLADGQNFAKLVDG